MISNRSQDKNKLEIKNIVDECFQDYKKTSMLISVSYCDWKCLKELNLSTDICQNCKLAQSKSQVWEVEDLVRRYIDNPVNHAVIFGGLEPMWDFIPILNFIHILRTTYNNLDDVVIYTGYYEDEIQEQLVTLSQYRNIIVKFGRYNPNLESRYDNVLQVTLASNNQYAVKIS